jgi:hypothetical protein
MVRNLNLKIILVLNQTIIGMKRKLIVNDLLKKSFFINCLNI